MPRSVMLVVVIGGGVFEELASAARSIALQLGGQLFSAVFLAGVVVAKFASGLVAQASASRLLYELGGDAVPPTLRWRIWWSPASWA